MSQSISKQKETEKKQALMNEAEIRNKALVNSLAVRMNRVSGQLKDYLYTNTGSGTNTLKTTIASTGVSDTGGKKGTNNTTGLIGGLAATIADSIKGKSGTDNVNNGTTKDKINTNKPTTMYVFSAGGKDDECVKIYGDTGSINNVGYIPQKGYGPQNKKAKDQAGSLDTNANNSVYAYSMGGMVAQTFLNSVIDNGNANSLGSIYLAAAAGNEQQWTPIVSTCVDSGTDVHFMYSTKGTNVNEDGTRVLRKDKKKQEDGQKINNTGGQGHIYANTVDVTFANIANKTIEGREPTETYDVQISTYKGAEKTGEAVVHVKKYENDDGKGDIYLEEFDFCGHSDLAENGISYYKQIEGK